MSPHQFMYPTVMPAQPKVALAEGATAGEPTDRPAVMTTTAMTPQPGDTGSHPALAAS